MPPSRLAAWSMFAFLAGIATHSLHPYAHIPAVHLLFPIFAAIFCLIAFHGRCYMLHVTCCVILAFTLGLLRFSFAQPRLPRSLIFANPKGLAIAQPLSRTANHLDPRHWLFRARVSIKERAYARFSPDQAALLTGILYGERELSKDAKTAFRHAGLLHLIAVSGSNMTIIVVMTMRLLLALRFSRRDAFFVLVLSITAFTLFVGPSASVLRAALMGLLVELAPLVGRLVRPTRLLLIAACAFVLWHPWALIFDASFALSFLAMFGLLTYGRRWNQRLSVHIRSPLLRETLSSTASATVLTMPYAAWAFGSFTLWGLLTNLLVLPLMSWTMFLGSLALLIPTRIAFLALPAEGCLEMILQIARLPDHAELGYLDRSFLSFPWLVASYAVLFLSTPTRRARIVSVAPVTLESTKKLSMIESSFYEA